VRRGHHRLYATARLPTQTRETLCVSWRQVGFGTQGDVYGYKLHAWVTPEGEIVQYLLKPANLHDTTVSYELNQRWPEFGGPKIIGDKGYCCLGYVFPPKKNSRYDTGWRKNRHPKLRKRIETVFSQLVEAQIRSVQTKTLASSLGVKSGEEEEKRPPRATSRLAQHGTEGIEATPEEAFG